MSDRSNPIREIVDVTPSDTTEYSPALRGFHVNVGGDVYVDAVNLGTNKKLTVLGGAYYPYEVTRVYSTNTTATVVGLR